jgi:NADH-quinone oxidoreductase chain I
MKFITDIFAGALTLLTGMRITMKHFLSPPVTTQYPLEKLEMSQAYRDVIVLIEKEELGTHDCIDCQACVRVCPSMCIEIEGHRPEGLKRKRATKFEVDFALCSECGLCLDVCPTDTLGYGRDYDEAGYQRSDFLYDLLKPWRAGEEAALERIGQVEAAKAAERDAKKKATTAAKKAAPPKDVESADAPAEKSDA